MDPSRPALGGHRLVLDFLFGCSHYRAPYTMNSTHAQTTQTSALYRLPCGVPRLREHYIASNPRSTQLRTSTLTPTSGTAEPSPQSFQTIIVRTSVSECDIARDEDDSSYT
jgi:hypothetical protein